MDRYVTLPIKVIPNAGVFASNLDGQPQIKPVEVSARVLKSQREQIDQSPTLTPLIENALRELSNAGGGTFDIPLESTWPGVKATFEPKTAQVTVRLRQNYEKVHLVPIPLNVIVDPSSLSQQYEIEWQDNADKIRDVHVNVPLGQVKPTNEDVIAFVVIEQDDLPSQAATRTESAPAPVESWIEKEVRFIFANGFEHIKIDSPPRKVRFRLKSQPPTNQ